MANGGRMLMDIIIDPYRRRTSLYHFLSRNQNHRPIMLHPLPKSSFTNHPHNSDNNYTRDGSRPQESRLPCVLVSVRLSLDTLETADIDSWTQWLLSAPKGTNAIRIEGREISIDAVYPSHSTLMVLRMPLEIWSLVKQDCALSFIGYVYGDNTAPVVRRQI
jgi:hypothetical protein